jgi:hypothetical protein
MRTGKIHLISKDSTHFLFHPNDSVLQAYVDGELKVSDVPVIVGHLENCGGCQRQVNQLKAAFQQFQEMQKLSDPGDNSSLAEGLAKVQDAIQDWRKQNQKGNPYRWEAATPRRSTSEQLFEEIGVYLGSKMTRTLSQDPGKTLEDHQKFILAAEPMLAAFFGNRAAARVHQITFQIACQGKSGPGKSVSNCALA